MQIGERGYYQLTRNTCPGGVYRYSRCLLQAVAPIRLKPSVKYTGSFPGIRGSSYLIGTVMYLIVNEQIVLAASSITVLRALKPSNIYSLLTSALSRLPPTVSAHCVKRMVTIIEPF